MPLFSALRARDGPPRSQSGDPTRACAALLTLRLRLAPGTRTRGARTMMLRGKGVMQRRCRRGGVSAMTKDQIKELLDRVLSWPPDDQERVAQFVREVERRRSGDDITDEEWKNIEARALRDLATDEEVAAVFSRAVKVEQLRALVQEGVASGFEEIAPDEFERIKRDSRARLASGKASRHGYVRRGPPLSRPWRCGVHCYRGAT
jgi:hypothetical protein